MKEAFFFKSLLQWFIAAKRQECSAKGQARIYKAAPCCRDFRALRAAADTLHQGTRPWGREAENKLLTSALSSETV